MEIAQKKKNLLVKFSETPEIIYDSHRTLCRADTQKVQSQRSAMGFCIQKMIIKSSNRFELIRFICLKKHNIYIFDIYIFAAQHFADSSFK